MRRALISIGIAIGLVGCGPIHPQWRNETDHPIVVTYVYGKNAYRSAIRPGKAEKPLSMVDFAKVQVIFVDDDGKRSAFNRQAIALMHKRCGHGYSCIITYQGAGRTPVHAT